MSSSSGDDCYGVTAGALNSLKNSWKPDIELNDYTSDHNITSDDSDKDKSPGRSTKVKRKHKKSTRNMDRALDLDTSATSDVSINANLRVSRNTSRHSQNLQPVIASIDLVASPITGSGSRSATNRLRGSTARGRPPRGRTSNRGKSSRGRRSRVRNQSASGNPVINIGCFSDSEESYQPLFSRSSNKEMDDVVDLDSSSLNEKNSDADSENEELSVKVHWRSKEYHKFKIRKYQKITEIFEFFARLEVVPVDNLLFTLDERVLRPNDTPASINYNICQFIEGGVVTQSVAAIAEHSAQKHEVSLEDALTEKLVLKFRSKEMKNPFEIKLGLNQKLSIAMIKFSEEIETPLNKLKFYFDGDHIDSESTPKSLDLEGGECLDVLIIE